MTGALYPVIRGYMFITHQSTNTRPSDKW